MIPSLVFGFVGVLLFAIAAVSFLKVRNEANGATPVRGVVSGHETYQSRSRTMFVAVFQATVDGRTLSGRSTIGKSWEGPPVGTAVSLLWLPNTNTLIAAGASRYLGAIIVGSVGAVMLVVAGIVGVASLAPDSREPPAQHDHATKLHDRPRDRRH